MEIGDRAQITQETIAQQLQNKTVLLLMIVAKATRNIKINHARLVSVKTINALSQKQHVQVTFIVARQAIRTTLRKNAPRENVILQLTNALLMFALTQIMETIQL